MINEDHNPYGQLFQLHDPNEHSVFSESLMIGGPVLEKKQTITNRGVYKLCFSLQGGKKGIIARFSFAE